MDFSFDLIKQSNTEAKTETQKLEPRKPPEQRKTPSLTFPLGGDEKSLETAVIDLRSDTAKRKEAIEAMAKMSRAQADRKRACAGLCHEIMAGTAQGENVYVMLVKACEAIALVTGEPLLVDSVKGNIEAIYSKGLGELQAQEYELEHVERKIQLLSNALNDCTEAEQRRIETALKLTRKRAEELGTAVYKE